MRVFIDENETEKPRKKKARYSPQQRISRSRRKIASYRRKIERLFDAIDAEAQTIAELGAEVELNEEFRRINRRVKKYVKNNPDPGVPYTC